MNSQSKATFRKREKTLLASLLLSAWGPITTGIAVVMSHSVTQLADFLRRTAELLALLLSWLVFRFISGAADLTSEEKMKWERIANYGVAAALGVSGLVMIVLALSRSRQYEPGGNVYLGLTIAVMGFIVNLWFWRRYSKLYREEQNLIMASQKRLYLAKMAVDICVITALCAVALMPTHNVTKYIDILGSVVVALYLLWSSWRGLNLKGARKKSSGQH